MVTQQITFSSGITVGVRPPGRAKALWLAAKFAPLAALPSGTPASVTVPLLLRVARQLLPYVTMQTPKGVEPVTYLSETVLRSMDDWGRLAEAVLSNAPGQARR